MNIIKTGVGITRTIKNAHRLKEIISVFAINGFGEFIGEGITSLIPNFVLPSSRVKTKLEWKERGKKEWTQAVATNLRECFEELGPTFIKFGQLISSREDLFDPIIIEEFKKLRDQAKGVHFSEVEEVLNRYYLKGLSEHFLSFEKKPLGVASIGLVYPATLNDGTEVVVKVRRPHIANIIETDFSILSFLVQQLEKFAEDFRYLGLSRIVDDFGLSLQSELNFNSERLNCERFRTIIESRDEKKILKIPKTYSRLSNEEILVIERLQGIAFSDPRILDKVEEMKPILMDGLDIFIKNFLQDGFFHADLHGGNFFYIESEKRIGIIDFGLMGSLGKKSRLNFISILYALVNFDFENLVYEFLDVAEYNEIPNVDQLTCDVKNSLGHFVGLSLQETKAGLILQAIVKTLGKHHIYLPRDWFIVFRALITLDGVGKSLNIDIDIIKLVEKDIEGLLKESFSRERILEEGMWAVKDLSTLARVLPRHAKWFLKDFSKKKYRFDLEQKDLLKGSLKVSRSLEMIARAIFAIGAFLSGTLMALKVSPTLELNTFPVIVWLMWVLAFVIYFFPFHFFKRNQDPK
jgi:ubiquinone biosynthesis protein